MIRCGCVATSHRTYIALNTARLVEEKTVPPIRPLLLLLVLVLGDVVGHHLQRA
jgi:hypothetical protein